jgi:hypothetical protein
LFNPVAGTLRCRNQIGKDTGGCAKNTVEYLWLTGAMDLMGSRNVDECSKAFGKMTLLKQSGWLACGGLRHTIWDHDETLSDMANYHVIKSILMSRVDLG